MVFLTGYYGTDQHSKSVRSPERGVFSLWHVSSRIDTETRKEQGLFPSARAQVQVKGKSSEWMWLISA